MDKPTPTERASFKSSLLPFSIQVPFSYRILFFFIFLPFSINAQNGKQWEKVQPSPTSEDLEDVHVLGPQKAVVVGKNETLLKTEDGGQSWTLIKTDTIEHHLYGVYFLNDTLGWAVGEYGPDHDKGFNKYITGGFLLRTEDGGDSWERRAKSEGIAMGYGRVYDVHFITASKGWVTHEDNYYGYWKHPDPVPGLFDTPNGGNNWEASLGFSDRSDLYSVFFATDQKGWAVGKRRENSSPLKRILRTKNSGKTWKEDSSVSLNREPLDVHFPNTSKGWIVGREGLVLHSKNGGKSWKKEKIGLQDHFDGVHFMNASKGWIVSYKNGLIHTSDGGNTWKKVDGTAGRALNALHFSNGHGYAVGDSGTIFFRHPEGYGPSRTSSAQELKVHPNPASQKVHVHLSSGKDGPVHLSLYDLEGNRVEQVHSHARKGEKHWDLGVGRLKRGLYILRVEGKGVRGILSQRVMIE